MKLNPPIFAALDVDSDQKALEIAQSVQSFVGGFKLGPRLVYRYGQSLVKQISEMAPVFVDNKYYDIPNTMESAVRATFEAGASFTTVHASAGPEALSRLAQVEKDLNQIRPFKVLAVTVLTSFSKETLPPTSIDADLDQQVHLLAESVIQSGLSGLVCSPEEVQKLRSSYSDAFLVTPGIRPQVLNSEDDQKRVATPRQALDRGASAMVIGRPIYDAKDPAQAAQSIFDSL